MSSDLLLHQRSGLSMSDLSRFYDVSLRTLRFYEQRGLLQPKRLGQARVYSAQDRRRLELILTGKKLGFSLSEIDNMIRSRQAASDAAPAGLVDILSKEAIEQQLQSLERQKADLEAAIDELKGTLPGEGQDRR